MNVVADVVLGASLGSRHWEAWYEGFAFSSSLYSSLRSASSDLPQ